MPAKRAELFSSSKFLAAISPGLRHRSISANTCHRRPNHRRQELLISSGGDDEAASYFDARGVIISIKWRMAVPEISHDKRRAPADALPR